MCQPIGKSKKFLVKTEAVMDALGSDVDQDRTMIVDLKGRASS